MSTKNSLLAWCTAAPKSCSSSLNRHRPVHLGLEDARGQRDPAGQRHPFANDSAVNVLLFVVAVGVSECHLRVAHQGEPRELAELAQLNQPVVDGAGKVDVVGAEPLLNDEQASRSSSTQNGPSWARPRGSSASGFAPAP